jgi:uncharacterized protein YjaZ
MKNLSLLSVIFLFACNQPPKKENSQQPDAPKVSPTAYAIGGGNKVVFLTDYYADYLKSVKAGIKNHDSLYRMKIQYPICNKYFSTCEWAQLISYSFYYPMQDTTGLEAELATIDNNKEKIEKTISSTLADCNKYLKNDSITVYVQPFEGGYMKNILKRMGGITAVTGGSKQVMLTIDPEVNIWSDKIADCIAHEFNHTYWTKMNFRNPGNKWNMLNYLVFEGRADAYAHFIYPAVLAPMDTALTEQQKTDLWARIKPELNNEDMTFQRKVMFGSLEDKVNYPLWGGYCLGFAIVESALKNNPKLTPEEWTNTAPEKILEMSDYK